MNARTLSQFMLANITLVIDRQGQIRELTAGAAPAPGEVVMTVSDGPDPQVQAQLIQPDNQPTQLNLDDEIAQILAQLEQGVDPTLNPDQATAAGGANGSSPTDTGTIDMTLAEVLAQTAFDTHGLQDSGLSQTQSLAIDLVVAQALAPIAPVVSAAALEADQSPYFVDDGLDDEDTHDTSVDENEDGQVEAYNISYFENSVGIDGENPTVLGQVKAFDPDFPDGGGTLEFSLEVDPDHPNDINYFTIDKETGEIYLTAEGAAAYTNDFEDSNGPDNEHHVYVVVSDGFNPSVKVPVTLNEMNVNEPPAFVDTSYSDKTDESDDPNNYLPGNDFEEATNDGESPAIATYKFYYDENKGEGDTIGQVQATDVDTVNLNYGIENNVSVTVGENTFDLYQINSSTGEISLTALGAQYYSNYEDGDNDHQITVYVQEDFGEGELGDKVYATVELFERNVNESPLGENFTLDVTDAEGVLFDFGDGKGEVKLVKVVFDNNLVPSEDHISDEDVDYLSTNPVLDDPNQDLIESQELFIYISQLPEQGSLYYWNAEQNNYVLIEEGDLYVDGNASPTKFDPNSIYYKAGEPNAFTINEDTTYTKYENGDAFYTLSNGAIIIVSATSELGGGSKGEVSFETNNGNDDNNQGEGFGVDTGNGINNGETLIFDLSANPLSSVSFGVDGLNSNHQATVVYTYLDGTKSDPMYYGDGSVSQSSDVSYSAPDDNPIVQIEFSESTHTSGSESNSSSGSNYVVSYISGEEAVLNDPVFEYTVVDSEDAMPLDENGEVITYQVSLDVENAYESNVVYANTGNDELVGDDGTNIFTWLDSALDNSTDTVKNFALGSDKIDVRDILEEDGNDANNLQQLVENIDVSVVDNDVTLVVTHDAGEQSIVIENLDLATYDVGGSFDAAAFLNDVLKTTDTTS
ncbi:type I secretion C-terminal target domain-containing protein [Vibrio sp. Y2-5]|uniref:type I secretion C-terminal target domain-containing protein n=1 Tax=Vibrio sp. Y2-5 TaxID=2743977 RepID=UPI0016613BF2|nr:type I secretion C-terminal target domain-containing protein [Vibrio sp. Y2-5]MBD0785474.1 type I secretion C-terminal target domain-containing protein [Vibrio sp. Y2-5]